MKRYFIPSLILTAGLTIASCSSQSPKPLPEFYYSLNSSSQELFQTAQNTNINEMIPAYIKLIKSCPESLRTKVKNHTAKEIFNANRYGRPLAKHGISLDEFNLAYDLAEDTNLKTEIIRHLVDVGEAIIEFRDGRDHSGLDQRLKKLAELAENPALKDSCLETASELNCQWVYSFGNRKVGIGLKTIMGLGFNN
jgi:hypothetical protein